MQRLTKSLLRIGTVLAGMAAAVLTVPTPAQAVEPQWDCGFVAVRDLLNQSTNGWLASFYAWGVGPVYSQLEVECWLQHSPSYNPAEYIVGTWVECTTSSAPTTCADTKTPTIYVHNTSVNRTTYLCGHGLWPFYNDQKCSEISSVEDCLDSSSYPDPVVLSLHFGCMLQPVEDARADVLQNLSTGGLLSLAQNPSQLEPPTLISLCVSLKLCISS